MRYAAEPVPSGVDPVLAEYLDRQFNAIGLAFTPEGRIVLPTTSTLPARKIPGAIVYIENGVDPTQNGFYGCVKDSQGEGEWKKLQLS
jgi:hypothetical protein